MPVTKSAIKAMKQSNAARERNRAVKVDFRGKVKAVKKAITAGGKDLEELTSTAVQAIDKAAKRGIIHKKAAARRKSRLMLAINKVTGKPLVAKSIKSPKTSTPKTVAKKKPATEAKPKTTVKKTTTTKTTKKASK